MVENNLVYTDTFQSSWSLDGATIINGIDSYTDEYGTVIPLTQLTANADTGEHVIERVNHWGNNLGIPYPLMVSCYVRAGTKPYLHMTPANVSSGPIFDTSLPGWSRTTGGSTTRNHNYIDKGNGLYRVWWTLVDSDLNTADPDFGFGVADDGNTGTFTADGTETIIFGGVMMERWYPGMTEPSPYVPNNSVNKQPGHTRVRIEGSNPTQTVTNLFINSDPSANGWNFLGGGTMQPNVAFDSGGYYTAARAIANNVGGTGIIGPYYSITLAPSTQYVFSIEAEAEAGNVINGIALRTQSFDLPSTGLSYFDFDTGTVSSVDIAHDDAIIEDLGEGRYRCSIVITSGAGGDLTGTLRVYLTEDGVITVPLDGVSSLLLSRGQLEVGSTPGPFVETTGASRTVTVGGIRNSLWKGAVEPTLIPNLYGLENLELELPTGLNNQEIPIQLVGSTILKINEYNSNQTIVDREFAVTVDLWNSNTTIQVPDS
jgi:hypothetical protein